MVTTPAIRNRSPTLRPLHLRVRVAKENTTESSAGWNNVLLRETRESTISFHSGWGDALPHREKRPDSAEIHLPDPTSVATIFW